MVEDDVTEGLERLYDGSEKGGAAAQYHLAEVEFSVEQGYASSHFRLGELYVMARASEPEVLRDAGSEQLARTLGAYLVSSETVMESSETDQTTVGLPKREEAPQGTWPAPPDGAAAPGAELTFAATLPYSADKEVSLLLAHAEGQVSNLALSTPKGDNAFETYQLVLSIQPNNQAALAGIEHIGLMYVKLANLAVAKGDLRKASHYATKATELASEHPLVQAMAVPVEAARPTSEEKTPPVVILTDTKESQQTSTEMQEVAEDGETSIAPSPSAAQKSSTESSDELISRFGFVPSRDESPS